MRHAGSLTLFSLPHAGGGAASYGHWNQYLDDRIAIHPVELPGHGARLSEKPIDDLEELVCHLVERLRDRIDELRPVQYALFGHSFGAILAFEVAARLRSAPEPAALLVSGRNGPGVGHRVPRTPHGTDRMHKLADEDLVTALREIEGIPPAIAMHPEVLELFLPAVRTDLRLAETYRPRPERRVDCPIAVLAAEADPMTDADGLAQWSDATSAHCLTRTVPGGHMAVQDPAFCRALLDTASALKLIDRTGKNRSDDVGSNRSDREARMR